MKKLLFCLFLVPLLSIAQDDLLDELEADTQDDSYLTSTFKGLKIVNFESTKLVNKREFYFVVAHRFGSVENGIDDLFGLDQAVTQLKFIYGITDALNVGFARSSYSKTYGAHVEA